MYAELFALDIENIMNAESNAKKAAEKILFRRLIQGEFQFSTIGDSYVMVTWEREEENIVYMRTPLTHEQFKSFIGKGPEYLQSDEVKKWQERSESTIIVTGAGEDKSMLN
jgi:hypothetical protein